MKSVDIISAAAGFIAAFLKSFKKRLNWRMITISSIVGAVLGFGVIGVLNFFLKDVSINVIILAAFSSGWVASDFTDVLEEAIKDGYDIAKAYAKNKAENKTNRKTRKPERNDDAN